MDSCQDTSTTSEFAALSEFGPFQLQPTPMKLWDKDVGVFVREEVALGSSPLGADASTLPGEVLTTAVTDNLEQRGILLSMLVKFAAHDVVSASTLRTAMSFLGCVPRVARIPQIGPAGDGALAMEWPADQDLGTLLTIDGDVFHYVLNAGSPQATYHDNLPLGRQLPTNLLQAIQG